MRRAAIVVTSALVSGLALGADRPDTIAFEAPAECGSAEAFAKRVGGHAGRAITIGKDAAIRVRIAAGPKGFHGTLRVMDEAGPTERAVDGKTCAEVVDALALVTSMALEEAQPSEVPSSAPSPAVSASAQASASASPSASTSTAPAAPPVSSSPTSDSHASSQWAVGGRLDVVVLDGTPLPFGGSLYGEWSRVADSFSPSIRLEISHFGVEREPSPGASVKLAWTLGEIDGCPVRVDLRPMRFDFCALATGGVLGVSSDGLSDSSSPNRFWLSVGALARARVGIGMGFFVEGRVAGIAPITRDRLVIAPGIEAYRPAPVTLNGGLGLGWYFP